MKEDVFREAREGIIRRLQAFLAEKETQGFQYEDMAPRLYRRLADFTGGGKMLRGGLVSLFYQFFSGTGGKENPAVIDTAAAMELFQSALLIHDDIMDRDYQRRGGPSFFYQYREDHRQEGVDDAYHLGESTGICGGDIAFFSAFELLSGLEADADIRSRILQLFSREMSWVGLAQVADVTWGSTPAIPGEADVLNLYRYKTGRYSFSLPMMAGTILAGRGPEDVAAVEKAGEELGIVFQIRDDELGIWGDPAKTGKPVGSDLREGKKTLHWIRLLEQADAQERAWMADLIRGKEIPEGDVEKLKALMEQYRIRDELAHYLLEVTHGARKRLHALAEGGPSGGENPCLGILDDLLDLNLNREK